MTPTKKRNGFAEKRPSFGPFFIPAIFRPNEKTPSFEGVDLGSLS